MANEIRKRVLVDALNSEVRTFLEKSMQLLLTEEDRLQFLTHKGLINQTPLQKLIEYNVTNGIGYEKRVGFFLAMQGLLIQKDMDMIAKYCVMDKQKVFSDYRRQK